MQQLFVVLAIIMYAAFSFNPLVDVTLFSRTLFLSPGEILTVVLVFGLFFRNLLQGRPTFANIRPSPVNGFLVAYILLAIVFILPTFLFFLLHNELLDNMMRSLLWYFRWVIALVLFYYGSDSQLSLGRLRLVVRIVIATFIVAVLAHMTVGSTGFNLMNIITTAFDSQYTRLEGPFPDPNQLGIIAVFFSIICVMGTLNEKKFESQILFSVLAVGTIVIMILTQSREAVLTMFVALLGVLFILWRTKQHVKMLVVLSFLIVGSMFVVTSIPRIAETILAVDTGNATYALNARDETWRTAWGIILSYPFGIGFENLSYLTNSLVWQAHNGFLQSAVIAGIIGIIAYLNFIFQLFQLFKVQVKLVPANWMLEAYFAFSIGYVATTMVSDHFIGFETFNAIFFGLLGFVACAR